MYVENSLQNSLFDLSAILKIRNGEHAHYVGLVVAYTWNREKQMFVALGKEFDMIPIFIWFKTICGIHGKTNLKSLRCACENGNRNNPTSVVRGSKFNQLCPIV